MSDIVGTFNSVIFVYLPKQCQVKLFSLLEGSLPEVAPQTFLAVFLDLVNGSRCNLFVNHLSMNLPLL